jgi:signal transduction histidine kinase/CheY-like chemotaxis protein/diadenosine tetraphosphatase ApaH/serine/threonine PP2A family protein phosphatase
MLFDLAGNLWIATTRGVTRVPRQVFESFDLRQELLDDEVTAIFELTPGELILGQLRGLAYFDGEHGQVLPFDMPKGLSPRLVRVLDIQPSSQEGTLWIAAASLGAARLGPQGKLDWFGRDAGLECNSVLEDRQGQVWVATSRGLYQLVADPSEDPTPGTPVALPWLQDEPVRRLYQAPSGDLYIGTTLSGLWRLRSEPGGLAATPESFSSAESEGANSIYSILELASGRVLVATRSGLFELAAAGLVRAPEARDLTRPVYSLLEDDAGRLWAGTSRGVERWEGGERRHYGVTQGLAGQETNRAAVLQDSQGQIWFGTDRGLSRYSERADSEPVDLVVQAVTMRSAGEVFHERHLPAHSDIEFDARLIYFAQDGARLRARLLGYESAWAPELSQGTRSVHYTNLPPGSYQLELQARRSRGTFGPSYFSSRVIIASPFYQQPWFFGLALLAGSLPLILSRTLIRARRKSRSLGALADESAQALEESEQRYQEIFTRTSTVQLVLDTCNWAIQEANPAACDYFKRSPAEIEGRALSELTGVSSAFLASSAARLEDSGGEIVLRTRATLKDGEAKLELRLCQYMLRGQRVLHVVVSDITRNIRLEESLRESQKLRAVGELASGVAHDFNNLLAAIMGFSELVTYEEPENQAIRRHVGGITEASSRGAKLVRQLLTFSRQQRLDSEDMDISSVVSDFSSLLRRLLDRNIEIICDLDPLAGSIHADKSQIETVLLYLALNARDAMPDGGQLTLRTRRIPAGAGGNANSGPQISLKVTDTGVGLDEETRMRIFEPFFSTKRNGTGMGLAEIHGIVGQSGGQIEVTSQPEEGTSFVILLPALDTVAAAAPVASDARSGRDPRAGKAPAQASGEADHGGAAMGALHILLVDDKEPVRLTVSTQLTSMGHRVHMSATGEEALAELQSAGDCFDLLLTDKSMPTISGLQLAERARELRPLLAVLLMSGFLDATEDHPELTILQKPFTMVELAQAIRVAVEEAKARGPKEGAATLDPEA